MNTLTFDFEGRVVRVVDVDGEPHFVGKDVCDRLGYTNASKAMGDHCKGVTKRYPLLTDGGMQEFRVLAEADVLRLIVNSKLPAAERFERRVFEEILPEVRRTGSYGRPRLDAKQMNAAGALVRLALKTFDKATAQALWRELGLPGGNACGEGAGRERPAAPPNPAPQVVHRFLDEACLRDPAALSQAAFLYSAFLAWAARNGVTEISGTAFGKALIALGIQRSNGRVRRYHGIKPRFAVEGFPRRPKNRLN